jgi:hypothetical protein
MKMMTGENKRSVVGKDVYVVSMCTKRVGKLLYGKRVKTDKRDSRKLAKLFEGNMLKRVYVLTHEELEHLDLLRT